jgi:hypothetical protein
MKEYKLKAAPAALRQEIKNQKAPKAKRILVPRLGRNLPNLRSGPVPDWSIVNARRLVGRGSARAAARDVIKGQRSVLVPRHE